jgi:hypothetical protein
MRSHLRQAKTLKGFSQSNTNEITTMDNNQDKHIYKRPESLYGEVIEDVSPLDDVELSQDEKQTFLEIERGYVSDAYNKISEARERALDGYEDRRQPEIELRSRHAVAAELRQIINEIETLREQHVASQRAQVQMMSALRRLAILLFSKDASYILEPTIEKVIDQESVLNTIFPKDPEVTKLKFFILSNEHGRKIYHQQESLNLKKHFINSYEPKEFGIEKSSTFYDESHGRVVNISVPVSDAEAQNLLIAAKRYYNEVTGKVYVKKAAPRLRFRSKDDYDLAA